ncbi:hypothetical protein KI387_023400, partial [Taxus chinensis]
YLCIQEVTLGRSIGNNNEDLTTHQKEDPELLCNHQRPEAVFNAPVLLSTL